MKKMNIFIFIDIFLSENVIVMYKMVFDCYSVGLDI